MLQSDTVRHDARHVAMDLLARRDHARKELFEKLTRRGFEPSEVDTTLQQLQQENLLNDERYAEHYIHQRIRKGYGPQRIFQELLLRGIDESVIQLQLDYHDEYWSRLMKQQRERKFGIEFPVDYREKMKQARFLQNRGFSPESVMRLFR